MTLLERIIHSTGPEECKSQWHLILVWIFQIRRTVSHRNVFGRDRKGHGLRSIHERPWQGFYQTQDGVSSMFWMYLEHEGNDRNLINQGQTHKTCESIWFCFRMNNPPVLKHGSRSLIWMRMWNDWNHTHATKVKKYIHDSLSRGRCNEIVFLSNKVDMLGPERWWTILELVEVEGNSDGRP